MQVAKKNAVGGVWHLFLLLVLLSFLGWAYETVFVYLTLGRYSDRGFLSLPFCPIYGSCLTGIYLLFGTPDEGRGILKKVKDPVKRKLLYLLFALLLPTGLELFIGLFFERYFHRKLWNYTKYPYQFKGYICLPVSLSWTVLIFLFMKLLFPFLKRLVDKCPKGLAVVLSIAFAILWVGDFITTAFVK
ncbi:MAG: putative ABC transporter permease [Clostridia bacterium]|nr:putative ABC transporter permease [Clostridia bacterium]